MDVDYPIGFEQVIELLRQWSKFIACFIASKDIVQEAFTIAYKKMDTLRDFKQV
ncbi:hypothetical protein [Alkaliphilus metalliredigens]|uniref:hypothetical protein n=1 Tax=Alkaliphilus metalliredigens TaxID=208226 RepID=UPI0002DC6D34|nr:hypothetical protein [Alkaliphilus metalliredigens]